MAVERGRSHGLVGSMVGAVYVHVLRTLIGAWGAWFEQLQTARWILGALVFLVGCELCAVSHFDTTAHVLRLMIISYSFEFFTGCAKGRLWSTAQTIAIEKGSPRVALYHPKKLVSPPRELSLLVSSLLAHYLLIYLRCQLSLATLIYDRPKLFCGLLLCFPKQLLILGDQSIQRFENDKSLFTKTSVTSELNVRLSWNFDT